MSLKKSIILKLLSKLKFSLTVKYFNIKLINQKLLLLYDYFIALPYLLSPAKKKKEKKVKEQYKK